MLTVDAGSVSLAQSTIAVTPANIQAGNSTQITLTARDQFGNQEAGGGGLTVSFALGSGNAGGSFSSVTDNHNGTYSAFFTGTIAGSNTLIGVVGFQDLTTPAASNTVTPAPFNLFQSLVSVSPANVPAGSSTTVTLTARDAFGNQETMGGLSVGFHLVLNNINGSVGLVHDNGDGTYTATLSGRHGPRQRHLVAATIGGLQTSTPPPPSMSSPAPMTWRPRP